MPRKPLALDQMVGEDEYWYRVFNDPRMWSDKKKETTMAKERHLKRRHRLSHYRDRSQDHDHHSESYNVWDLDFEDTADDMCTTDGKSDTTTPLNLEAANDRASTVDNSESSISAALCKFASRAALIRLNTASISLINLRRNLEHPNHTSKPWQTILLRSSQEFRRRLLKPFKINLRCTFLIWVALTLMDLARYCPGTLFLARLVD
jgi:hypothetical protein